MSSVPIRLFGSVSLESSDYIAAKFPPGKLQDLLCYLLVHHDQKLSREIVASAFWEDSSTSQSKKYLRTALWQLRTALQACFGATGALELDSSFVTLNAKDYFWIDVAEFEAICNAVMNLPAGSLGNDTLEAVKRAVSLYSDDLLPGNYCEWCLKHRERLQGMYLALLDKLLSYCELHEDEDGVRTYGSLLLQCNPLSERTYQRLMRFYHSVGDRGSALAEYEKCVTMLRETLGIEPSSATADLCRQIRSESHGKPSLVPFPKPPISANKDDLFTHLTHIESILVELQQYVSLHLGTMGGATGSANPLPKR